MRKFLIKSVLVIFGAGALLTWFKGGGDLLGSGGALGLDDSAGWTAANSHKPEVMDTLDAASVGMMRVELPWNAVELSPGVFAWEAETDDGYIDYHDLFNRMRQRGIQPVVVLSGGPTYLNHLYPQQPVFTDDLLANWEDFVDAAVEEFGVDVDHWQVGGVINDPTDWGRVLFPDDENALAAPDAALYARMLVSAHSVIKSAQAGDTVFSGELAMDGDCAYHPVNYLAALNAEKVWYALDGFNIGLPILEDTPETVIVDECGTLPAQLSGIPAADSLRAIVETVDEYADKPVWVHNLRFSQEILKNAALERGTISEAIASDYLARMSALLLSYGKAERVFWAFEPLRNTPGLVAMQTFANLNGNLGVRFDGASTPAGSDAIALRFRGGGKLAIMAWTVNSGADLSPVLVSDVEGYDLLAYSADSDSVRDKDGVPLPVDDGGNTALMIGERPVLITGRPDDIKQTVTQTVQDGAQAAKTGVQNKLAGWLAAQKTRAADRISDWIADQQTSLMNSLRSSLQEWLRESLGLA